VEPLQVIAAPRRLRILELVWDQELSAGEIAAQFEVSWPAVSQHLRVLKEAGFVVRAPARHQPHLPGRQGRSRALRSASKITGGAAWDGSRIWPRPNSAKKDRS
jgi:Predicted transcriptional regulators